MSSKRIFYATYMSPPARAVRMTLEALGVDYEFRLVDTFGGETRKPEFLKKNPLHTVPVLEETDGTCIWDSHAIMSYLVRRYGKNDDLFPKGYYERAIVEERLHYENGSLFIALVKNFIGPLLRGYITKEHVPALLKIVEENYDILEIFLGDNDYIAGKNLTIADFSIVATVASVTAFVPIEKVKYPKLNAWFERMQKLPYYDMVNTKGVTMLEEKMRAKL